MTVDYEALLRDTKAKIDLLALAVDYAAAGINSQTHPRAQANVAIADKKLQQIIDWFDNRAISPGDIPAFIQFLDREIASAQSYLAASTEKTSDDKWWGVGLLVMVILAVAAAVKVWLF